MFINRLIKAIKEKNNSSVVGLDPRVEYIPDYILNRSYGCYGQTLRGAASALFDFNKVIIDAVADIVPAVKPQIAYYEMYGVEGMKAFFKTVEYAQNAGLMVIGDCKRNDIGSTANCYADAYLGTTKVGDREYRAFPLDAMTINPYLGDDGIMPFVNTCINNKTGVFVLVKTSNQSSVQLQDLELKSGECIYQIVAKHVSDASHSCIGAEGYSNIGAVVGATYPKQAHEIRSIMKHSYFLVPGYGKQGGTGKDVVACFNSDGLGAIINSSRDILLAYEHGYSRNTVCETDLRRVVTQKVIDMRDDINHAKEQYL